jgi:hypothetical protein
VVDEYPHPYIPIFLAASTECSAGSNDHFVVGVGVGVPSLVQFDGRPLGGANFQHCAITQTCNATITQPCTQQNNHTTLQHNNHATFNATMTQPFNTTITQHCNARITQPCNATITQPCNATLTQLCNTTITQPFNATIMQPYYKTITQPCNATITQPCNATIMQPRNNATITQPCKNQNCNVVVDLLDLEKQNWLAAILLKDFSKSWCRGIEKVRTYVLSSWRRDSWVRKHFLLPRMSSISSFSGATACVANLLRMIYKNKAWN